MARRGFQGAVLRGLGARDHLATVIDTELVAPSFLRIGFESDTLFDEIEAAPTAWLRFWFPDPDGGTTEFQRAYTISESEPEHGRFWADFVLHEPAGPASTWALRATPGDTLSLTSLGSTRFEVPDEPPAGYLLVGDSASIPAISAILRTVPADVPVELYLEQHDPDDLRIPLPEHPRARIHWVPRTDAGSLAAAIESRDWSDWFAWIAPESGSLKALRTRLRDEFGFPKSEQHLQAYWVEGREMGKNRAPEPGGAAAESTARAESTSLAEPTSVQGRPDEPDGRDESTPEADAVTVAAGTRAEAATFATGQPAAVPLDESTPSAEPSATPTGTETGAARPGVWRARAGARLLRPLRPTLWVAGIVQGIVTLVELAPYVLLAELARLLLAGAPPERLWTVGLWAFVLLAAGAFCSSALLFWLHLVDARFEADVRRRMLGKLARLPLGWFERRTAGSVKQIVQDDTLALHYLVTHAVPDAVAAVVAPVAVLVYLFTVDWRIALVLLVPVIAYIVVMATMIARSGPRTAQAARWAERMNGEAGGYLEGQPVVRVFGGAASSTFRHRLGEYIRFLDDWQRPFIAQKALMDLMTRPATSLLLMVLLGTLLVTGGAMDPLALLPFLLLGTTFGARLLGIGYGLSGLRAGTLAARRVQQTLEEPELDTAAATDVPADAEGPARATDGLRVEFEQVGFAYRPGVPVLDDITLTLEPGTLTALVGPSGSGKSTLAALLARFHDVGAGVVRVGGRDVRSLSPDELYARVGFVFQDTQLVHGSVRDNIALAVPDASDEEVERAARAAQVHERIARMPEGYATVLGPDAALSGGERQRLTIARAILADAPVLVLDEATAFADPESEYLVQRALERLTAGRTVLVIAHRLHTVTGADRIVVLDGGRIAEQGTHDGLLAANGRYRRLWEAGDVPELGPATADEQEATR